MHPKSTLSSLLSGLYSSATDSSTMSSKPSGRTRISLYSNSSIATITATVLLVVCLSLFPSASYANSFLSDEPSENQEAVATNIPVFISKSNEIVARENSTSYLECDVKDLGEYVLLWKFNKKFVLFAGNFPIQKKDGIFKNNQTNGIIIKHLTNDLIGEYTCELSTTPPSYIVYNVTMATAPIIVPTPQSGTITVRKNEPLQLRCNVKPSTQTPVTYEWQYHSKTLEHNSSVFEIGRVQSSDSGDFACIAKNNIGERRFTFKVAVQFEPEVKVSEKIIHGPIGNDVEVRCEANAYPRAEISWQFSNNSRVGNSNKHKIVNHENYSILKIRNVDLKDYDMYYCSANNSIGSQSVFFEVTGKPSKPRFTSPQVGNNGDSYQIEWTVVSQSPILSYDLRIREIKHEGHGMTSEWRHIPIAPKENDGGSIHTQTFLLELLSEFNSYEIDLEVENEFGKTRSDIFSFATVGVDRLDNNKIDQAHMDSMRDLNSATLLAGLLPMSIVLMLISMFVQQQLR